MAGAGFEAVVAEAEARDGVRLYEPPEDDRQSYTIRDERGEVTGHVRPHLGPPGLGWVIEDERGEIEGFLTPVVPGSDTLLERDRDFRPTGRVIRRR